MLSNILPHLWYLTEVRRRQEAEQTRREVEQECREAKQARREAERARRQAEAQTEILKAQLAAATAPRRRHRQRRGR